MSGSHHCGPDSQTATTFSSNYLHDTTKAFFAYIPTMQKTLFNCATLIRKLRGVPEKF